MKKNNESIFQGICTALITPFSDGRIDYDSAERLIEFQISEGIDALLVCGTTGESATLSEKEKKAFIRFAVDQVGGRVPVIAGTGSNCTSDAVHLSKYADSVGADALLCVTPYYNKASEEGLLLHYRAISEAVSIPVIIYNVPSRTGLNISPHLYEALASLGNIAGVKEASGSVAYFTELTEKYGDVLDIYSGNDDLLIPSLDAGGVGIFSVLSNLLPGKLGIIYRLWNSGNDSEACDLYDQLSPLIKALFAEVNPIPVKALLASIGLCREEYRLPLCPLPDDKRNILLKAAEPYISS